MGTNVKFNWLLKNTGLLALDYNLCSLPFTEDEVYVFARAVVKLECAIRMDNES